MEKPKIIETNTNDKLKPKDAKSLPSKLFINRNSILTDLFENLHIKMLYNISMVVFIGLLLSNFLNDYLKYGKINLGQTCIFNSFGNWSTVFYIWIIMFLISLLTFPSFRLWARIKLTFKFKSKNSRLWDNLWILFVIGYYIFTLYVPAKLLTGVKMPVLSKAVVLSESIRFLMKEHAFIRSNVPKVLNYKPSNDKSPIPSFAQFIYFLFIPTAVYQDEYPRTKEIRWKFVFECFFDFFMGLLFLSVIVEMFIASIDDVCIVKQKWEMFFLNVFQNALYGVLITFVFFYMFLHSWMNAFAEMLRFGDRLFYKEWWISTSYMKFYRTWNSVVHDWLYTYILKDFYEIVTPGNKILSRIVVILVSAIFHEYLLALMLGFFFPVLLINYFVPTLMFWVIGEANSSLGNLLVIFSQGFGLSLFIASYTTEYLARQVCPSDDSWHNYFVPAIIRCNCYY